MLPHHYTTMSIIGCYILVFLSNTLINTITRDKVVTPYVLSIIVNVSCLATLFWQRFSPSYMAAKTTMHMLMAYYAFDINKLIDNNNDMREKLTFIPHHVASIVLIGGQLHNLYPLHLGMWFLAYFEFSNMFLQFFQMANKKHWTQFRNLVAYPFALTYIPIRGLVIPIYSLNFVSHILKLPQWLCLTYVTMFVFIDIFSVYFAWVVLTKFIKHLTH